MKKLFYWSLLTVSTIVFGISGSSEYEALNAIIINGLVIIASLATMCYSASKVLK